MLVSREIHNSINRRIRRFIVLVILSFVVVISRLYYLQIYMHQYYYTLSNKNRILIQTILPSRGKILDRNGVVLADNTIAYNVLLNPKNINRDILRYFPHINIKSTTKPIVVKTTTNWDDLVKYSILANIYECLTIEPITVRNYVFPLATSHIIGYVGAPSNGAMDNKRLCLNPNVKIGKIGIEKQYDNELFGDIGFNEVEVNAKRQPIRTINTINSKNGADLHLTVDINLQCAIYDLLSKHRSGACVVMNIENGEILSLVSYPGYDINAFTRQSSKYISELYANPDKPLINKAINGLYAPGSAFKLITGLAGLHYNVIDENTRFYCSGYVQLGNRKFYCWKNKYGGHGSLNIQQALEQSCDCFFYQLAHKLGIDKLSNIAHVIGLGQKTNIDLLYEKSGLIPTRKWKRQYKNTGWTIGDTYNTAIGQGFVLSTPLQLAVMTASLSNDMYRVTPHLNINLTPKPIKINNISDDNVQIILDGMYDVVNSYRGTAHRSQIPDIEFAGKTGSSQVCRITKEQRLQNKTVSDIYENKEHALFVAYAPVENPKYAVCVLIEHGGSGAAVAAPIAKDIFLKLRELRYI